MGKILVTRIVSLGLAAYISREIFYREKQPLERDPLQNPLMLEPKNAAAQWKFMEVSAIIQ